MRFVFFLSSLLFFSMKMSVYFDSFVCFIERQLLSFSFCFSFVSVFVRQSFSQSICVCVYVRAEAMPFRLSLENEASVLKYHQLKLKLVITLSDFPI